MFVGLFLLMAGMCLYTLEVTSRLAIVLAAVGFVYFIIGVALALIHDKHMAERTQAGRESE